MKYIIGDATCPVGNGNKIIAHCVNDLGYFGAGFAKAILNKWPHVRKYYLDWHNEVVRGGSDRLCLGSAQIVLAQDDVFVANIVGQYGIGRGSKDPPIRYEAIREGLIKVKDWSEQYKATVHMPKIGSGLAGGDWNIIEKIIIEELSDKNVEVFIYKLY